MFPTYGFGFSGFLESFFRGWTLREFAEVQAIFSERKDDLNLALDEMKDKVTNLMNAPGKDRALNHPFPVRVLKGEKVQMEGHEVPTRWGWGGGNLDGEFLGGEY